jgi:hypothetical protein
LGLGFAKFANHGACGLAGRAPNEGRLMLSTLSELDIIASGIPKTWACIDCCVNTAPGCPNAAQVAMAFKAAVLNPSAVRLTFGEDSEVYIRKPAVWKAVCRTLGKDYQAAVDAEGPDSAARVPLIHPAHRENGKLFKCRSCK